LINDIEISKATLSGLQLKVLTDFIRATLSRDIPGEPNDIPPPGIVNKEVRDIP